MPRALTLELPSMAVLQGMRLPVVGATRIKLFAGFLSWLSMATFGSVDLQPANQLRQDNDAIYGLMSSHPAVCLTAAKAFGSKEHTTLTTLWLILTF
jgi:hypothetical protein